MPASRDQWAEVIVPIRQAGGCIVGQTLPVKRQTRGRVIPCRIPPARARFSRAVPGRGTARRAVFQHRRIEGFCVDAHAAQSYSIPDKPFEATGNVQLRALTLRSAAAEAEKRSLEGL